MLKVEGSNPGGSISFLSWKIQEKVEDLFKNERLYVAEIFLRRVTKPQFLAEGRRHSRQKSSKKDRWNPLQAGIFLTLELMYHYLCRLRNKALKRTDGNPSNWQLSHTLEMKPSMFLIWSKELRKKKTFSTINNSQPLWCQNTYK